MDRDQRIEEIFHAALERATEERDAFLAGACGTDQDLMAEVSSLLAAHDQPDDFIDAPAVELAKELLAEPELGAPELGAMDGRPFGHYRILSPLGAGGMGVVYLAEDAHLSRKVALKLLPPHFTQFPDRLRRFIREAKSVSALNHPNIITIHEIGEVEGVHYIATEFIDGETLRQKICGAEMKLREAIDLATQVAAALASAHAAGIVHRDIKPENIMARRDGYAKVLDFGLAKLTDPAQGAVLSSKTLKAGGTTTPGVVMGTITYMSPEQARGLEVDARSDIFSLGVVLYEMITGAPPFVGVTTADVIAAILTYEPPRLSHSAPGSLAELGRIVSKALRKDRLRRYQDINNLLMDLKELRQELEFETELEIPLQRDVTAAASGRQKGAVTGQSRTVATGEVSVARANLSFEHLMGEIKRYKLWVGLSLAGMAVAVAVIGLGWYYRLGAGRPGLPSAAFKSIPLTSLHGSETEPAFSPDGSRIAFVWNGENEDNYDIYVQIINTGPPLRLTNNPAPDIAPSWSPDGGHIAFARVAGEERTIFLIPAMGGPERKLLSITAATESWKAARLSWSQDGKLLAFPGKDSPQDATNIFLLSIETLEKRRLLPTPAGYVDMVPAFSPDGKILAFIRRYGTSNREIYLVPAAGGEPARLTHDNRTIDSLAWAPDGRALFFTSDREGGNSLWRISVSGGAPEQLYLGRDDVYEVAVSQQSHRLAYLQSMTDTNIWRWENPGLSGRAKAPVKLIASTRQETNPQYSPDGNKIVFTSDRSGHPEIWVCESDGSNPIRLTSFNGPSAGSPRWSPDGRQIAFDCTAAGTRDIYVVSVEGGPSRRLTTEPSEDVRPSWSRDGRWIYFGSNRGGGWQVWKTPVGSGEAVQITRGGGHEAFESPDGKFVYYSLRPAILGIWRVPVGGGEEVRLVDQGAQSNWVVLDQGIYFLTSRTNARSNVEFFNFATGRVTQIGEIEKQLNTAGPSLSVSPDGRWFLFSRLDQGGSDIMLVENFR
ncbi:MAG TPA: protein kinase [Blastocatellia bacterium]|nr:protein kinase [Blastocatellia bacterium]